MTNSPADEVCDLLSRWARGPVVRCEVLAHLDQRGWPAVADPNDPRLLLADPGWDGGKKYFLLLIFDRGDRLSGFTALMPDTVPGEPVLSAVTVGVAAERLFGEGRRRGPGWLAWNTPGGRCEVMHADGTVVSWRHCRAGDGDQSRRAGRVDIDSLITGVAADPRWPPSVEAAQSMLGGDSSWERTALGALAVLAVAERDGLAPVEVSGQQLDQALRSLRVVTAAKRPASHDQDGRDQDG